MAKIKNANIGKCSVCNRDIWRAEPGWVVMPRDAIYIDYVCHTVDPKTDCLSKYGTPKALL